MSAALRVFVVLPDGSPTAAHRTTVAILPHLPRHDVEPVVCFLGEGPLCGVCRDDLGVETILVPAGSGRGGLQVVTLLMTGAKVGLVHSVSERVHLLAGRAARRARLPAVWSQFDVPAFGTMRSLRAALAPARSVFAASSLIEARQRRFNPRRIPVARVPPAVERQGEFGWERREVARSSLAIAPEEFAVGWLAGPDPAAGLGVAVRAVASLCHARPHARLVVIPTPASPLNAGLKDAVRPLAISLGIAPQVSVAPPHERAGASPVLVALDVALYTEADADPVGLPPIEALAAGVPVVAADQPPIRDSVEHGRTGLLLPRGDSEAFAAALLALADDPERRAAMAVAALETAAGRHDAAAVAEQVAGIYRKAVGA